MSPTSSPPKGRDLRLRSASVRITEKSLETIRSAAAGGGSGKAYKRPGDDSVK